MSSFCCCCCCVSYDFREETIFGSSLIPFVLFMLNVSMYVHWFPRRCHCHMMLVYFNSNTTYRTGTAYPSGTLEFTPGINGVHVTQSLVFCVVLCSPLFVPLSVFPFDHCIVCSSIYVFWLPLCNLQTVFIEQTTKHFTFCNIRTCWFLNYLGAILTIICLLEYFK